MHRGLSSRQVQQFHDDGFLIVRDLLPREAYQPFIEELVEKVDVGDVLLTMERVLHRSTPHTIKSARWSLDVRYNRIGLPTGRKHVPGFVARSRSNPQSVAKSHRDWLRIFEEAGVDPIRN